MSINLMQENEIITTIVKPISEMMQVLRNRVSVVLPMEFENRLGKFKFSEFCKVVEYETPKGIEHYFEFDPLKLTIEQMNKRISNFKELMFRESLDITADDLNNGSLLSISIINHFENNPINPVTIKLIHPELDMDRLGNGEILEFAENKYQILDNEIISVTDCSGDEEQHNIREFDWTEFETDRHYEYHSAFTFILEVIVRPYILML